MSPRPRLPLREDELANPRQGEDPHRPHLFSSERLQLFQNPASRRFAQIEFPSQMLGQFHFRQPSFHVASLEAPTSSESSQKPRPVESFQPRGLYIKEAENPQIFSPSTRRPFDGSFPFDAPEHGGECQLAGLWAPLLKQISRLMWRFVLLPFCGLGPMRQGLAAAEALDPKAVELSDPHSNAAFVSPDPPRNIRCRKPFG